MRHQITRDMKEAMRSEHYILTHANVQILGAAVRLY